MARRSWQAGQIRRVAATYGGVPGGAEIDPGRRTARDLPAWDQHQLPQAGAGLTASDYVAFADVSVIFGRGEGAVRALDRVSLGFEKGSFIPVVGPSGCGKSTLLHTLAGFQQASSGTVSPSSRFRGIMAHSHQRLA